MMSSLYGGRSTRGRYPWQYYGHLSRMSLLSTCSRAINDEKGEQHILVEEVLNCRFSKRKVSTFHRLRGLCLGYDCPMTFSSILDVIPDLDYWKYRISKSRSCGLHSDLHRISGGVRKT